MQAATYFGPGALIIDWYDPLIYDPLYRKYLLFNRINKIKAPGDTTGGFDQTAYGTARAADKRAMSFSATNPTRAERTRRTVKCICKDISFGAYDLSLAQQQGNQWGDLQAKDVQDEKNACLKLWSRLFYEGDIDNSALEFDGLRKLLNAGHVDIASSVSILDTLWSNIATMVSGSDEEVMPSAIYVNGMVRHMIAQELLTIGEKQLPTITIFVGNTPLVVDQIWTPAGILPLIVDPFNKALSGTPVTYPTFVVSEDKLSWQYVEVLGAAGAEPKTYEISLTNALDRQYKTVMFGAEELLGGTAHHMRFDVVTRTSPVKPVTAQA